MSDEQGLSDQLRSLHIERAAPARRSGGFPRWLIVVVVLALLGGGAWFVLHRAEDRLFPEEVELGAVTLISPQQQDVTLVATGYVYTRKRATVAPKATGRLDKLFVDEGAQVKEGQVIAELDSSGPLAQVAQVKADVAAGRAKVERARADLADADLKLAREQKLAASGAGTAASLDDAKSRSLGLKAALVAAEADVTATQARHQAAQVQLDDTKVRAPFGGTVIRKLAEIGEVVTPGGTGLFLIGDLADLEVQADVSESQLSKVKVGTPAEILLDAFPEQRFSGTVREIRNTVDRAKATVTVKVGFDDVAKGVLPDMAAKVSFREKALDKEALKMAPKLVAPADAVVDRGGKKVLLTIADNRVHEVPVTPAGMIGQGVTAMVEIGGGVPSGTRVVRSPGPELHEGTSIKEKETSK